MSPSPVPPFSCFPMQVVGSTSDRNIVVLNDIQIDVMDYLEPAHCGDTEFRELWQENEWENLVRRGRNGCTIFERGCAMEKMELFCS